MKETHFPVLKREDMSEVIRKTLAAPAAPAPSAGAPPSSPEDRSRIILNQTARAEEATTVRTRFPKFFNPLFRKQNIVNRALIAGVRECATLFTRLSRELDSFASRQEEKNRDCADEIVEHRDLLRTLHRKLGEHSKRQEAMETELKELKQREQESDRILQSLVSMTVRQNGLTQEALPKDLAEAPRFSELLQKLQKKKAFLDPLYLRFEDLFRESRKIVRERIQVYLPYLEPLERNGAAAGILDIGCGRGEWIELLEEHGYRAEGVDINPSMIAVCREFKLKAHHADFLKYLGETPDSSLQLLTSFHLVEHLSFDNLVSFLREAVRTLKPGGLLIFETPNPGNLQVGSHYFHLDPTHNKPIPAMSLKFLIEECGLSVLETLYLNPYPEKLHVHEESQAAAAINEHLYTARDYGIIARKGSLT